MNGNSLSLLRQIMELEFTAIELNLFLDTHPDDQEALRDLRMVNERLQSLTAEYERLRGPLFPFSAEGARDHWRWIDEPWPWEIIY
ncbi:MAG: spore coat protein CotJB [Bacillota bacterium]